MKTGPKGDGREALSKRLRFEVFKRDGFKCQYCGATPVQAALVVDHVVPVAGGGRNDQNNLITACEPCNQGKGAVPLDKTTLQRSTITEAQREQVEQIQEYLKVQDGIRSAKQQVVKKLVRQWRRWFDDMPPSLPQRLPFMIEKIGYERVVEAIEVTCSKDGRRKSQGFSPWSQVEALMYLNGVVRKMGAEAS